MTRQHSFHDKGSREAWSADGTRFYALRAVQRRGYSATPVGFFEGDPLPSQKDSFVLDIIDIPAKEMQSQAVPATVGKAIGHFGSRGVKKLAASPQGQYLLCLAGDVLFVMNLRTGDLWQTPEHVRVEQAEWTEDGAIIIFQIERKMWCQRSETFAQGYQPEVAPENTAFELQRVEKKAAVELLEPQSVQPQLVVTQRTGEQVVLHPKKWHLGLSTRPILWEKPVCLLDVVVTLSCQVDPTGTYLVERRGREYLVVDLPTGAGSFLLSKLQSGE